ncbi:hypothetical protein GCM10023226_07340 [Nocardioides nanhaiensis]|uniref:Polysaccharide pyruvyl transferase domain-containing protein n=1 Tax=Nocardioides nanhaiensis TaxID=1476871 RepID=A0ABP8VWZ5_9ACTN
MTAPAGDLNTFGRLRDVATRFVGRTPTRVFQAIQASDRVVAVGGGYMRFGHATESFKTSNVHLPQWESATRLGRPLFLLPQSIGPLGRSRNAVREILASAERVYVRDERSFEDLRDISTVRRAPDLAVMELAKDLNLLERSPSGGTIGLIFRPLRGRTAYPDSVRRLSERLTQSGAIGLLQSSAGSGNQDDAFMRSVGVQPADRLLNRLTVHSERPSVTVSVRLHGSLQSLLAGVPSIHLSYERKGFSAYDDLGLSNWVHNAYSFDPELVAEQAHSLREDSSGYWNSIVIAQAKIENARQQLLLDLAAFLTD